MAHPSIQLAAVDIIGNPGTVNGTGNGRLTQTGQASGSLNLDTILTRFWNGNAGIVFLVITIVAIVILTIAAGQYAAAKGDPAKTTKARNTLVQTTLGVALLVASTAVLSLIITIVQAGASAAQ